MARLIVSFTFAQSDATENNNLAQGDFVTTDIVSLSGSHAESDAAGTNQNTVSLYTDTDCWVEIGATPVATVDGADCWFMAEGERLWFSIAEGQKVSGIADS